MIAAVEKKSRVHEEGACKELAHVVSCHGILLQIWLQERDDHLGHLVECTGTWQRFPTSTLTAKDSAIAIAAEVGQQSHHGRPLLTSSAAINAWVP
nr:hypothetical protein [Cupriavidus basilensis]